MNKEITLDDLNEVTESSERDFEVTLKADEERRLAKTINFGVMYGGINYICQGATNPDIFDKLTKEVNYER